MVMGLQSQRMVFIRNNFVNIVQAVGESSMLSLNFTIRPCNRTILEYGSGESPTIEQSSSIMGSSKTRTRDLMLNRRPSLWNRKYRPVFDEYEEDDLSSSDDSDLIQVPYKVCIK